ncbi:MAG TPA: aldo/keto reductase [Actinomycetota bacterium]|nr:aldo/keto reductase [Actinomycetota bacterium]
MPVLGLGTSPLNDAETERIVAAALDVGYRLIDTAENYRNEAGVGRGIRASGIDRDEVFVTTKLNKRWHGYEEAQQAWSNSAERLGLDRIDLLLIHWPNPQQNRYVDAWRGMVQLLEDGKVRAIGVSNFKPAHLDRLVDETGITPHVNQIELDPRISRREERAYHEAHDIVTESWSPLGAGGGLLREPAIGEIAERHGRTPAQIVLRWHVQLGLVAIPRTSKHERLSENLDVFDFALTDEEMERLAELDGRDRVTDSDRFGH